PGDGFSFGVMAEKSMLDHDEFGSNRSKLINVIDSNILARDSCEKPVSTFSHPALAWHSRIAATGALFSAVLAASVLAAQSQEATDPGKQQQPIPWTSTCTSPGRGLPQECALRQRALIGKTRQLIGMITIRVPSDTKKPVIMIQTPLGLFL